MTETEGILSCCEFCGSMVHKKRTLDGARFYVPVKEAPMFAALDARDSIDSFLYDRLRRAEHIIVDLRKQLAEAKRVQPTPESGNV